jgi:hypothetical protein
MHFNSEGSADPTRGGMVMADYKLYYMKDAGHIVNQHDISAPDDETAFKRAWELSQGEHVIEVYDLARVVGRVTKIGEIIKPDRAPTSRPSLSRPSQPKSDFPRST